MGAPRQAAAGTAVIRKNPPEVATRPATKRATRTRDTRGSRRHAPRHAGASTLSSHREVKRLSRAVYAVQPSANEQRPLKWSHVPIIFDVEDHPDRTTGVGILPLVVSPVIHNVTVNKMLEIGRAHV